MLQWNIDTTLDGTPKDTQPEIDTLLMMLDVTTRTYIIHSWSP